MTSLTLFTPAGALAKAEPLKRACISAIAHIAQGSSVTKSSHSGSR